MYKRRYITDEEKINCQKVADAFAELFQNEDLVVLNAGKYGFVKLQYFKFPFGFDNIDSFYDCKSLFDELWEEWLHTQLINLTADTPMADMDYEDILKCLPEEKREELLDMRLSLAEKTGIEGILEKCKPDLWSDEFMKTTKIWSRDWEHFDWEQVRGKLCGSETGSQEGKAADKPDIGITKLIYENGERMQEAEKRITGDADPDLGKFLRFEEQPKDPAALRGVLWDEKYSRDHFDSGDIKTHIEKLSGKEKKPSLRAQLAQDKETVKAAPKKQAAKTKNKGLEV